MTTAPPGGLPGAVWTLLGTVGNLPGAVAHLRVLAGGAKRDLPGVATLPSEDQKRQTPHPGAAEPPPPPRGTEHPRGLRISGKSLTRAMVPPQEAEAPRGPPRGGSASKKIVTGGGTPRGPPKSGIDPRIPPSGRGAPRGPPGGGGSSTRGVSTPKGTPRVGDAHIVPPTGILIPRGPLRGGVAPPKGIGHFKSNTRDASAPRCHSRGGDALRDPPRPGENPMGPPGTCWVRRRPRNSQGRLAPYGPPKARQVAPRVLLNDDGAPQGGLPRQWGPPGRDGDLSWAVVHLRVLPRLEALSQGLLGQRLFPPLSGAGMPGASIGGGPQGIFKDAPSLRLVAPLRSLPGSKQRPGQHSLPGVDALRRPLRAGSIPRVPPGAPVVLFWAVAPPGALPGAKSSPEALLRGSRTASSSHTVTGVPKASSRVGGAIRGPLLGSGASAALPGASLPGNPIACLVMVPRTACCSGAKRGPPRGGDAAHEDS
ncbi:basic salivary proline-rich protein 2-like [Homarus americanus]|uniref:basic salivary proline-rich protein 2-like n=1 Tax=Homarus americanus TaxID=6706 RepID=UPI001C44AC10|nr:basic salivary proline-rich protein 2-like [Homarus americanus]